MADRGRKRGRSPSSSSSPPRKRSPPRQNKRSPSPQRSHRNRSYSPRGNNRDRSQSPRRNRSRSPRRNRSPRRDDPRLHSQGYRPANRGGQKKKWKPEQEPDVDKQVWGKKKEDSSSSDSEEPEKPNFGPSGLLHEELTTQNGIKLTYVECPDGKAPTTKWRLYPIKEGETLAHIPIWKKSFFLLGRDRKVVDIPLDHPSCSKQHAVIQFRSITVTDEVGIMRKVNRPYIIDLGSTNGVFLNGSKLDSSRYVELLEKDLIKFGTSSREYVLLHEGSQ